MRVAFVCLSLVLLSAETIKLREPYQSIVDLAHAAPPEFASDALLRVVESGRIRDVKSSTALIEEAFRLAGSAQYRMPLRAISGNFADSQTADLDQAYRLKLDSLTLQSRAVRDMLSADKAKARELFNEIPKPVLGSLTCADALVPDVSAFYDAVGAVTQNTFSEKERAKEEHINFLLGHLAHVTTPMQLAPAVRLLQGLSLTPGQRDVVLGRINALIENMSPDDRSFSATVNELKAGIAPELSASFEKYLQRGSTGERCSDGRAVNLNGSATPSNVSKIADGPKIARYWQSDEAKLIFDEARRLRIRPNGTLLSPADRSTPDWNLQLTDFLKDVGAWTSAQESSASVYYHEKCAVYEALLDLTPRGEQRDQTLSSFISFLVASTLQQENPVEWFVHAPQLYERLKSAGDGEAEKLLNAYRESGNPVLVLFAALEKTFGSTLPSWVPAGVSSN